MSQPGMYSSAAEIKEMVASTSPASVTKSGRETDEQIIAKYEEMFASRYTADDPAYQPYMDKDMDPPPIVEHFHVNRRQRPNWHDNSRDQRYQRDGWSKRRHENSGQSNDEYRQKRPYCQQDHTDYRQSRDGPHQTQREWRGRDHRQGQGLRPPWERQNDGRERGRYRETQEQGRWHQRNSYSQPNEDEWT